MGAHTRVARDLNVVAGIRDLHPPAAADDSLQQRDALAGGAAALALGLTFSRKRSRAATSSSHLR
jgi:hypothetical protein